MTIYKPDFREDQKFIWMGMDETTLKKIAELELQITFKPLMVLMLCTSVHVKYYTA